MDLLNSSQLTDEEIASRVQSGEVAYFGALLKRYEGKMLRYAKKFLFGYEEAEDMVQEVFVKAYINIQSFDSAKKFSPWIYRIAHNEFINAIKKKKREPLSFFDFDTFFPHPVSKQNTDQEINNDFLNKYVHKLDPKYREPIILYFFEGLSYKEIADVMRIPVATVGVRLKRGKEIIKTFYE